MLTYTRLGSIVALYCAEPHDPANFVRYLVRRTKIFSFLLVVSLLMYREEPKEPPYIVSVSNRRTKSSVSFLTLVIFKQKQKQSENRILVGQIFFVCSFPAFLRTCHRHNYQCLRLTEKDITSCGRVDALDPDSPTLVKEINHLLRRLK